MARAGYGVATDYGTPRRVLVHRPGSELECKACVGPNPITGMRLSVDQGIIGRSVRGPLGRGGPDLTLTTVNGSIKLRSATS